MIDCLIVVWLLVWNWVELNFLKVKWEGIKGLSQTFTLLLWSSWIQIHHKTLERRWHHFFHLFKWKGLLKIFEFHLKIFQQKLYATQWFSWEKIKWLLQNLRNTSWEFQRIKFKVPLKLFFKSGVIWPFIQIIFLQK